ncbi:MAG TPA: DNA polymerase III subunit gamma/tau [Candidatus Dormibacteraeota bacterium]|nr:DNA polymerase III subunit gamma/tau [Candidatus Dormibacteraeota bacterium]
MSYKVIARKYRPQTFAEIVGQQHVTRTLANAIQSNRVAHAYIFSGVRGVGKTTAARILAKALNCANGPTPEPDDTCDSCREITAGTSLDVLEIDAASNRGIDQIRELREMVRYAPAASRYKVVILDEAHQLTDEASNALLKTLEEPPERVVFILATTRAEDLVETIKSRAQLFQFRSLTFQEIAGQIEHIAKAENLKIDTGAIAVLARAAEGSVRDGLSLLEQAMAYGGDTITDAQVRELLGVVAESVLDDLVEAIATQSSERALSLVHRLIADGQNLQHFCREGIRHFRNLLVARVCGADSELIAAPADERPRLAHQSAQFSEEDLTRFFNVLVATEDDLRRKPDQRLHLELGLLKLINAQRLAPLEEAIAELRGENSGTPRAANPVRHSGASASASAAPAPSPSIAHNAATPASPTVTAPVPARSAPAQAASNSSGAAVRMAPAAESSATTELSAASAPAAPWARTALTETAASPSAPISTPFAPNSPSSVAAERSESVESAQRPIPASPPRVIARAAEDSVAGLASAQVDAIKSALQSHRFLWSMVEHATRWEIEGNELNLFFPTESRALAEMLQARDPMERLRTVLNQVMGQPLRVCVRLESGRVGNTRGADLRARFEEDPIVRAMLEKFGGRISNVKSPGEE